MHCIYDKNKKTLVIVISTEFLILMKMLDHNFLDKYTQYTCIYNCLDINNHLKNI